MKNLIIFVVGIISFVFCELVWLTFFGFASSNWVLETTPGLVLCLLTLALFAMGCAYKFYDCDSGNLWMFFGVCVSITIMLFIVGPGNLWPIVLVIDYILAVPSIFFGWFIGEKIRKQYGNSLSHTF